MGVKDRILEYVKCKRITVRQFELKSNLSNGYVSSMRKGFGTGKLDNVLNAFPDINREWLLYGEGEMLKKEEPNNDTPINVSDGNKLIDVIVKQLEIKDKEIEKKNEQIDRLITILESNRGNELHADDGDRAAN